MDGSTLITDFAKVTPTQQKALKRLGIVTIYDLLYHFPSRYSDFSTVTLISRLKPKESATIFGTLSNLKTKKSFRGNIPMAEGKLTDLEGNTIKVIWFNQAYLAKMLHDGDTVKLTGKVSEKNGTLSFMNPEVEQTPDMPIDNHASLFGDKKHSEVFGFPVYRESRGVTSKWMYHTIRKLLQQNVLDTLLDPIPESVRTAYKLPDLKTALVWVHMPQKRNDAEAARKRFAFEEIFLIQIHKAQQRNTFLRQFSCQIDISEKDVAAYIDRFPFTPTNAQTSALDAIIGDITSPHPMSRLVEGDVGSGKTFIGAVAAYLVATNRPLDKNANKQDFGRLQVAYMAPTEVLASQLFENFTQYFKDTGLQIGLLTGGSCRKFPSKVDPAGYTDISKNQLLKWIAGGEIPIVVGTHALIQKKVSFKDLGLVIIDEQHRFGTTQRMNLAKAQGHAPHYLSMTATPIPRTLALTIYGDLDLTIVDQMPKGRKAVQTEIVKPDDKSREIIYEKIREELRADRQAYIICPRIDEPDPEKENALQLKSVKAEAKRLQKDIFADFRIDIMHSKMKKAEKEAVMQKFYNHETDILVSTSVVEVGVNVPNATSIIIEGAERFGLSQLHQLRGRVQRSTHQAYCYLFADSKSDKTNDRLKAFIKAKNGFELAELDLSLRGAGDLAGKKQWGITDLGMEAIKNIKMVELARTEAKKIVEEDASLKNYPTLEQVIADRNFAKHLE